MGATPPASMIPQAWLAKFATVQMPDVPVSNGNNGYPTYSNGKPGTDSSICSFTYQCTTADDLVNPPDGVWAVSTLVSSLSILYYSKVADTDCRLRLTMDLVLPAGTLTTS